MDFELSSAATASGRRCASLARRDDLRRAQLPAPIGVCATLEPAGRATIRPQPQTCATPVPTAEPAADQKRPGGTIRHRLPQQRRSATPRTPSARRASDIKRQG